MGYRDVLDYKFPLVRWEVFHGEFARFLVSRNSFEFGSRPALVFHSALLSLSFIKLIRLVCLVAFLVSVVAAARATLATMLAPVVLVTFR